MSSFRYLIIGAGGTGGAIGAYLTRAGLDAALIARGEQLKALKAQGLCIERPGKKEERVQVKAFGMEEYTEMVRKQGNAARPDVIFVCVKGYSLEETVPFIKSAAKAETVVIPILNIYGTGRKLQAMLPGLTVTDGCIYVSANLKEPGALLMHGDIFRIVYGIPGRPANDERLLRTADDLRCAGISPVYSAQIEKDAMAKFSYVSAQATCGFYFHAPAGKMQKEGRERELFIALCKEIEALAAAGGIQYETPLWQTNLKILDGLLPTASTSMQRDIYAGRRSEIDGLIYEVVRMGRRLRVSLPSYEKIVQQLSQ